MATGLEISNLALVSKFISSHIVISHHCAIHAEKTSLVVTFVQSISSAILIPPNHAQAKKIANIANKKFFFIFLYIKK